MAQEGRGRTRWALKKTHKDLVARADKQASAQRRYESLDPAELLETLKAKAIALPVDSSDEQPTLQTIERRVDQFENWFQESWVNVEQVTAERFIRLMQENQALRAHKSSSKTEIEQLNESLDSAMRDERRCSERRKTLQAELNSSVEDVRAAEQRVTQCLATAAKTEAGLRRQLQMKEKARDAREQLRRKESEIEQHDSKTDAMRAATAQRNANIMRNTKAKRQPIDRTRTSRKISRNIAAERRAKSTTR